MEIKKYKCTECGASLEIKDDMESIYCSYCGTKNYVDDEASNITRVEKAKLNARKEKDAYEDEKMYCEKRKKSSIKKWSIFLAIFDSLMVYSSFEQGMILSGIIGVIKTILFIYVFCICIEVIKEPQKNIYKLVYIISILLYIPFLIWL